MAGFLFICGNYVTFCHTIKKLHVLTLLYCPPLPLMVFSVALALSAASISHPLKQHLVCRLPSASFHVKAAQGLQIFMFLRVSLRPRDSGPRHWPQVFKRTYFGFSTQPSLKHHTNCRTCDNRFS